MFTKSNKLHTRWRKATFSGISTKSHCETPHRVTQCIWFNTSTFSWQDTVKLSPPKVQLGSYKRWMSCRKRWCWTCERGCWPLPPPLDIDLGLLLVIDPTKSSAGTSPPVTQLSDGLWSPSSSDWDLIQPPCLLLSLWLTCQLTLTPLGRCVSTPWSSEKVMVFMGSRRLLALASLAVWRIVAVAGVGGLSFFII